MAPIPVTSRAYRFHYNQSAPLSMSKVPRGWGIDVAYHQVVHRPMHVRNGSQLWKCRVTESDVTTTDAPSSTPDSATPSTSSNSSAPTLSEGLRLRKTMAGLDALLGIQDDAKAQSASASSSAQLQPPVQQPGGSSLSGTSIQKAGSTSGKPDMEEHIQKIIDKARKLADEQSSSGPTSSSDQQQQALKREFESLLESLAKPQELLSKDDIKALKDAAFGPLTFWVTETRPIQEAERTGYLIRGNLRDDQEKVFKQLCQKVEELFGAKFEVLMVEDSEESSEGMGGMGGADMPSTSVGTARGLREGARVAFQIVPSSQAQPPQTDNLQRFAAFILGLVVVVSTLELALSANISRLPKETLEYFADPANLNSDQLPPGLESWDPSTYLDTALPIVTALLGVNLMHEVGHRIAALVKKVRMGPSFFIPFAEIGSLGAITPFASLLRNRSEMWDVSAAGPLAGTLAAGSLLVFGLAQSSGVDPTDAAASASFISIPTQLFQNSLLLGGMARVALGEQALRGAVVLVHPFVVAGWWGLITNALNMLPVGSLDGGRMVQAAYGQKTLALTSLFTYLGLGLGFLGSNLALPFGLYVIICQRTAEKYIKDNVAPAGDSRMTTTAAAVLLSILILLPMAPELADSFGVGSTSPFL